MPIAIDQKEADANGEGAVNVQVNSVGSGGVDFSFRVTGRSCTPSFTTATNLLLPNMPLYVDGSAPLNTSVDATQYVGSSALQVEESILDAQQKPGLHTEPILESVNSFSLLPCANQVAPPFLDPNDPNVQIAGGYVAPFFFADAADANTSNEHTFFVVPSLTETTVSEWGGWAILPVSITSQLINWLNNVDLNAQVPIAGPVVVSPADPIASIYPLKSSVDWMTDSRTVVSYGNTWIGQSGKIDMGASLATGRLTAAGTGGTARLGKTAPPEPSPPGK